MCCKALHERHPGRGNSKAKLALVAFGERERGGVGVGLEHLDLPAARFIRQTKLPPLLLLCYFSPQLGMRASSWGAQSPSGAVLQTVRVPRESKGWVLKVSLIKKVKKSPPIWQSN